MVASTAHNRYLDEAMAAPTVRGRYLDEAVTCLRPISTKTDGTFRSGHSSHCTSSQYSYYPEILKHV